MRISIWLVLMVWLGGCVAHSPAPDAPAAAAAPAGSATAPSQRSSAGPYVAPELAERPNIAVMPYPTARRANRRVQRQPLAAPVASGDAGSVDMRQLDARIATQRRAVQQARGKAIFDATLALAGSCAERANATDDASERARWYAEAITLYKQLATDPALSSHPELDEALYGLGSALQATGAGAQARKVYLRLIKNFPTSRYIPHVYLAFGEYYFAQNSPATARKFYEKVSQFPSSEVYAYARYKMAWVDHNLGYTRDALDGFYAVIARTKRSSKPADQRLNRAAKFDFVRVYASIGKPELAYKAFQRVDKTMAFELLHRLGDQYVAMGMTREAIAVRREQLALRPDDPERCRYQLDIVQASLASEERAAVVAELTRLVELRANVARDRALPETTRQRCADETRAYVGELSRAWHRELTPQPSDEAAAIIVLYRLYVTEFPDSPNAPLNQYYLADLLWRDARRSATPDAAITAWTDAIAAFGRFLDMTDQPPGDAIDGAVLACKNALAIADATGHRPPALVRAARATLTAVVRDHGAHPLASTANSLLGGL